jgi:hypothetical protein
MAGKPVGAGDRDIGMDPERAGAIIRALTSAEVYSELVAGEGWTPDQYETWLAGLLGEALLRPR